MFSHAAAIRVAAHNRILEEPAAQSTCCDPSEKASCCDDSHGAGCGCAAGSTQSTGTATAVVAEVRETVRQKFGSSLYAQTGEDDAPEAAVTASLGCGVPTAVAALHEGETALDLGSGAGADVLISARRVGPTVKAIGLDMTDEMLELARRNAADAGPDNAEFIKGHLEDLPLPDASVDVVISNCVINLVGDKNRVIAEAARVLRPGGRFAVSDVIADPNMDEATKADMAAWTGCIAGALVESEFREALTRAVELDPRQPQALVPALPLSACGQRSIAESSDLEQIRIPRPLVFGVRHEVKERVMLASTFRLRSRVGIRPPDC